MAGNINFFNSFNRFKNFFCAAAYAVLLFSFFSCENAVSSDDSFSDDEAKFEIKGIFKVEGAAPAEILAESLCSSSVPEKQARSGSASIPETVYYKVAAKNSASAKFYEGTASGSSFSVKVSKGSWIVEAEGFSDKSKTFSILKGSTSVSVSDDYSVESGIEISMSPLTDGKGNILLEIQRAADSGIKSFRTELNKITEAETVFSENIDFPADSDSARLEKAEVDSGSYILRLEFYSELAGSGNLLFCTQETVNVFKNLTTDTWQGNSSYLSGGKFAVSKEAVETFSMRTFFVQGSSGSYTPAAPASDSNSGTYFAPLRTVQAAVDKIESINDSVSSYTVMVDGNIDAEAGDFRSTYSESSTLIEIYPSKKLTVTIRSFSSDSVAVLNLNSHGRGFYIVGNASVTLENIEISNGLLQYISGKTNGSVIYCKGNLSLKNCIFRNNRTKHGSGALFFIGENLEISGSKFVDNKGSSSCGGIFCKGNSSLQNCTFENNSGRLGGAIEFSDGNHSVSGCEFIGNTVARSNGSDRVAAIKRSNGSAICCSGNMNLTISDSEFKNNISEEGSAIDLYYGNSTVNIESGLFSGNKSESSIDRGAIYVENGNLRLGGSVTIENSDSNGICLAPGKTIEIISKLSPENSAYTAKLVFEKFQFGQRPIICNEEQYTLTEDDFKKFLVSDSGNEGWHINQYGYLTKPVSIRTFENTWNTEIYTDVTVSTLEELEKFASLVNDNEYTMENFSINLKKDITIDSSSSFYGIGNPSYKCYFSGIFNGNGNTIKSDKNDLDSIFLVVKNGTIKNLKSAGIFKYAGIVKKIEDGLVENCENNANIKGGAGEIGGIVSSAENTSIIRCRNKGDVRVSSSYTTNYVGGICGYMKTGGNIEDCMNTGLVECTDSTKDSYIGGIAAYFSQSNEKINGVFNSVNAGALRNTEASSNSYTGGIIGQAYLFYENNTYIKNCVNFGTIGCDSGENFHSGNIICLISGDSWLYKFIGVSNCYSNNEPFFYDGYNFDDLFEICKVNSFSKFVSKFSTDQELTVGNVTSTNLVELLNAWVEEENSSGGAYLKWQYFARDPGDPLEVELVYEN